MVDLDPRDLLVKTYTAGPLSETAVTVTHTKWGLSATSSHRSPLVAKRAAIDALRDLLNALPDEGM